MSRKRKAKSPSVSRRDLARSRRDAERRRNRIKATILASIALGIVALFVSWGVIRAGNQPGRAVEDMGNQHIAEGTQSPVTYNSTPPTSGPHYETIARWGIYNEPLPDELMVHNLEDGGVGIWYDCPDGCSDLVNQLSSIAQRYQDGVLMAPYPGMDTRIALTAWNRIDKLGTFDEERIVRFIQAFRGKDHHVLQ